MANATATADPHRSSSSTSDEGSAGVANPSPPLDRGLTERRAVQGDPRCARVGRQAFLRTSLSKSQVTGALRFIDSFTMCATAAAWWPVRPSSMEGLRVRTESKKRPMWM